MTLKGSVCIAHINCLILVDHIIKYFAYKAFKFLPVKK